MTGAADRSSEAVVRSLPAWVRLGSVAVRAVHLTSCAAILGSRLVEAEDLSLGPWWTAAVLSGILLMVTEWAAHPGLWRLLAGWTTMFKLLLLGVARVVPELATMLIMTAFVMAAFGAHLPKRWRHRRMI